MTTKFCSILAKVRNTCKTVIQKLQLNKAISRTSILILRKKCLYSELFWSKCGKIRNRITLNTDTLSVVPQNG